MARTVLFFISPPSGSPQVGRSTRPVAAFIFPICEKEVLPPVTDAVLTPGHSGKAGWAPCSLSSCWRRHVFGTLLLLQESRHGWFVLLGV